MNPSFNQTPTHHYSVATKTTDKSKTMLAYVLVEPGHMELCEVAKPSPEPGGVIVKIRSALTCGTDLKAFLRGHPKFPMPTLFGHEFSGEVAEVGEGVTLFKEGDPVMSTPSGPCGKCYYCLRGQGNLCDIVMSTIALGAYAEYMHIPQHIVKQNMYVKPPNLSFQEAALLEPLSCVLHGFNCINFRGDETVLIIGSGAIGLLQLLALKAYGIQNIIVAGRRTFRLQKAKELGATYIIDVEKELAKDSVFEITQGHGADVVIECTGQPEVWELAVKTTRRGGHAMLFGGCKKGTTVTFDTHHLHYNQITIHSPFHMTPTSVKQAFDLLSSSNIQWSQLITKEYKLSQLNEVFEALQKSDCIKYAVTP